jgi:surface antigen
VIWNHLTPQNNFITGGTKNEKDFSNGPVGNVPLYAVGFCAGLLQYIYFRTAKNNNQFQPTWCNGKNWTL